MFDLSDIFDILCYIFAHNGDEPFKDRHHSLLFFVFFLVFSFCLVFVFWVFGFLFLFFLFFVFLFFWFVVAYCTQLLSQAMYNLMMATTMAETCSC